MPHIHEKIDWSVDVFIVNGDAVLLRKHDKYKMWLAPGGHVELDETPDVAAVREAKEETGLDVTLVGDVPAIGEGVGYKELLVPAFMNIHPINDVHSHMSLVYVATSESRDVHDGETEVSDGMRWFTRDELDDPSWEIKETILHYARHALTLVGK
ncbi:MAG: NUDIX domain-containing protein [Candidatus Pacebacteria bacterium]|nr:NUDIX domain-containing protein [Candidatus Paceibacterota bacterium]